MRKAYDFVGWEHLRDSLREVFLPLLWRIFYDPLLCEVKRQVDECGYRLNSHFISGCGCVESRAGVFLFFTASAFVDDTIWVGSSQSVTQHILNIASEFFNVNDISINNNKTVAIPINCDGSASSLLISRSPISIAKKEKLHRYLVIYLSTEGLSKPSLAKVYSDVQFFSNLVLKKAVFDKQFSYLVSAVFFPIIGYKTQFSYILISACGKCDTMICKGLRSKSGLLCDFPNDVIYHPSLYGLKTFEQKTFKQWKWLDPRGPVPVWFELSVYFLGSVSSFPICSTLLADCGSSDVLRSHKFGIIGASLFNSNVGRFSVYTDESLSDLGTVDMKTGAAVFFKDIGMGLGVGVSGLMSSTLTELQAIALVLKCIPFFHLVDLFSDSQAALNACKLEIELICPDFRNWCWIKCCHIVNVICRKNLKVNWCKVKGHLEVLGNERADKLARAAVLSGWHLPHSVDERYLRGGGAAIFGNSRHFVQDIFWSVHCAHWEISCSMEVVADSLYTDIDWFRSLLTLHHWLPVAVHKQLYDKCYPSVVCLFCSNIEVSDHVFSCSFDANGHAQLLDIHAAVWGVRSSLDHSSSGVSQLMSTCVSDISVSTALCKDFVFKDWFRESVSVFKDSRIASQNIVAFVRGFSLAFWEDIWLVCAKHCAFMEKNGLIPCNGSVPVSIFGLSLGLSSGVTQLLGVAEAIGIVGCRAGAAVFFEDIGLGLGVSVSGLMSSTLVELQTVALALECVLSSSFVCLFSDSQSALDACRSELDLVCPDFCNRCWVKRHHIVNVIRSKNLRVRFRKVKSHSGVSGNERADAIAGATSLSNWYLPLHLSERFLTANGGIVSGNSRHFEVGSGSGILVDSLSSEVDWPHSSLVWHPDLHMAAGFTSRYSSSVHTYFMKSLYHCLLVAVRKRLYDKRYPSVLCLYCGEVEVLDHVFSCKVDESVRHQLLDSYVGSWKALSGSFHSSSDILQLLSSSVSDSSVSMALFKGFVFNGWFNEAVSVFHNSKIAVLEIVKFVHSLGLAFRKDVWSICAKHCAYMEKNELILLDGSAIISVHGLASRFFAGVVKLLGITSALGVYFGFRKACLFFSGIGESVAISKKKAPIEVFYGPVKSSFSQKKRVSIGNIKHSEDEKDISLVKPNPSHGVYSDMDSVSGDNKDNNVSFDVGNGFFLGLVTNTPKVKRVNTDLVCGSPLGSIDYVGTTAHDLGTFLEGAGGKTCVINHFLETGNRIHYTVVGFDSEDGLESAFCTEPIFGGVRLSWTRLNLVWCEKCGKSGHLALEYNASGTLVSFDSGSGSGFFSSGASGLSGGFPFVLTNNSSLNACLVSLECSLKLLSDQISNIVHKLNSIKLMPLVPSPFSGLSVVPMNVNLNSNLDMVLDSSVVVPMFFPVAPALGLNSSKILTTKVDCLESKLVALEASIGLVLVKLDELCAGLGF
ncbi:hypothetical protein G9A89_020589 [Geosiphon pyriformis]|nr:hypothetical protein G9A89_020589 [Geosiphon pyriformis]